MTDYVLIAVSFCIGIGLAHLFKILFEVRWNECQDAIRMWFEP